MYLLFSSASPPSGLMLQGKVRSSNSAVAGDSAAAIYVGVIAASYALMQFLFAPIVGAISARFGRRPLSRRS